MPAFNSTPPVQEPRFPQFIRPPCCRLQVFEAFPAPINSKIKNKGYNYGMYLDTSLIDGGTYDIDVITTKNNQYYSSGVKTQLELEE